MGCLCLSQRFQILITFGVILILIGCFVSTKYLEFGSKKVTLDIGHSEMKLNKEKDRQQALINASTLMQDDVSDETIYSDSEAKANTKDEAISKFIASAKSENLEGFMQSFDPQALNSSLLEEENENNLEVIEQFMKEILRDGIKEVQVIETKKEQQKREVLITYQGNETTRIVISFSRSSSVHHDHDHGVGDYVIATPPTKVIEEIKQNLKPAS